ncbi:TraR/DksA C4-type zinc finger protein [Magnetospirillum fulvum]|uniref:TraR/DksA family transcriptional regulator n=1 Tax=Magnetospirillum fulvum MGU-K5 TaxID=1316936 RepID=S9S9W5_MAGFU|nr:TraR/DksA C4-type zinc finger protein [Magnetospirillum fulvum]EPY00868.1 TraR/DksA family transcriptional regulator [Magnetospirillum fulvum MGU-K5]
MDAYDDAQALEQRQRDQAVTTAAALARARQQGIGSDICVVCEEPIPEGRRRAAPHANTCLACQAELEATTRWP